MLYIFFIILCCLIFAYVPNIFMSSSNNYIAARMVISIGIIIPLISIYIIINYNYKLDKIVKYILIFVTFINFTYLGYNYLKNYKLGLETYRRDQDYILSITNKIREYESKNKIKIKNIYYGNDMAVYYHYNDGVSNGFNYCIQSVDWAFIGYLNYMLGKNCNFYPLDKNEVDELFGQVDYNNYDDKQLIFDGNTLYLLLY